MQYKMKTATHQFQPKVLEITFESQAELDAFYAIATHLNIGNAAESTFGVDPMPVELTRILKGAGAREPEPWYKFVDKLKELVNS